MSAAWHCLSQASSCVSCLISWHIMMSLLIFFKPPVFPFRREISHPSVYIKITAMAYPLFLSLAKRCNLYRTYGLDLTWECFFQVFFRYFIFTDSHPIPRHYWLFVIFKAMLLSVVCHWFLTTRDQTIAIIHTKRSAAKPPVGGCPTRYVRVVKLRWQHWNHICLLLVSRPGPSISQPWYFLVSVPCRSDELSCSSCSCQYPGMWFLVLNNLNVTVNFLYATNS